MEKEVIVKLKSDVKEIASNEWKWTDDDAEFLFACAINYAEGLVQGLAYGGWYFYRSMVQPIDGYKWWSYCEDIHVSVRNAQGKIIRKPEDI